MRPCVKCGAAIGNADATCAECGAQQLPSVGVNPEAPVGQPAPDDVSSNEQRAWINLFKLVALLCLLGILLTLAFQVFGTTGRAVAIVAVGLAPLLVGLVLRG